MLGKFSIEGIPPAPEAVEGILVSFDLDANGILTVTAEVEATGNTKQLVIDAKTTGRLTSQEIDTLVKKAEDMSILDDKEEERINMQNRLRGLCSEILLEFNSGSSAKERTLLQKVNLYKCWLSMHPDVETAIYQTKFNELMCEVRALPDQVHQDYSPLLATTKRSSTRVTAIYCLEEGRKLLDGTTADLKAALNHFRRAHKIGKEKGQVAHMVQASKLMGHTRRLLLDPKHKQGRVRICMEAALRLTDAMELDDRKHLSNQERVELIRDMQFVNEEFFKEIQNHTDDDKIHNLKGYMLALENTKNIDSTTWVKTVFSACIKQIKIYLNKVSACISVGDFKLALKLISELTLPIDQAIRFSDSSAEDRQVQETKREVARYSQIVKGMQELQYAKECLEAKGDPVDLSWLAIDHLIEAMKLTKTLHPKTYSQARLMEGEIFLNTVNNKEKASICFEDIVKNHKTTVAYVDAKFNLDQLVAQKRRENNAKRRPESTTTSDEMRKLEVAASLSDEDFAHFVFTQLPPKHKSNCKMPVLQDKKKAFFRLASFYHPDKVNESEWGKEYKMLCEAISKQFNARYAKMK